MIRALAFNIAFYAWTTFVCIIFLPLLLFPYRVLLFAVEKYIDGIYALEKILLNLRYEMRGQEQLPKGAFILAAKHQSTWETKKLYRWFKNPAIVLKRELMDLPLWGLYARKLRLIPVDRKAGRDALEKLIAAARGAVKEGRPIVIFPQGTRLPPGAKRPYKIGVAALAHAYNIPIVPLALNSGYFWGRSFWERRSGTVQVQILPLLWPQGNEAETLALLVEKLETAADALLDPALPNPALPSPGLPSLGLPDRALPDPPTNP